MFLLRFLPCPALFLFTALWIHAHPPGMIDPNEKWQIQIEDKKIEEAAAAAQKSTPTVAAVRGDFFVEKEVLRLVNEYRQEKNLPLLEVNSVLTDLAREHSRKMAAHEVPFGHAGYDSRFSEARAKIFNIFHMAENVGINRSSNEEAIRQTVALWLKSPVHRHHILGVYGLTGIGVYKDPNGTLYFTQIFARIGF
jgi:uncharacterized protein YkwD